jgi:hypothetical protein
MLELALRLTIGPRSFIHPSFRLYYVWCSDFASKEEMLLSDIEHGGATSSERAIKFDRSLIHVLIQISFHGFQSLI